MYNLKVFLCSFFIVITVFANAQQVDNWYYNVDENKVFLSGYDVVAYHTEEQAIEGKEEITAEHAGIKYQFSNEKNRSEFLKKPEQYLPAYGGWCTFLMGIDKSVFPPTRSKPDPTNFKFLNGKLHLFGKNQQQDFKTAFEQGDSSRIIQQANTFWATRIALANKAPKGLPKGMNPDARMELLDWMPFMADWECDLSWWADTTGQNKLKYTGKWYFDYGYFGYCIQDDFMGDQDGNFSGTINGPGIRGYDPVNEEWHMTFIPVNQPRDNTWLMRGKFLSDNLLEGTMETKDASGAPILQKVRFESQSNDKFIWTADWSYDNGVTWLESVGYSVCIRINKKRKN